MRRLALGFTLLAAFLAGPASAQQKPDSALSDEEKVTKSTADQVDRQYKAAINRTRKEGAEARVDPWSNMRGTEAATKPKR